MSIKLHRASITGSSLVNGCARSLYPLTTMEWQNTLLSIVPPDLIPSGGTIALKQADQPPAGLIAIAGR